jgi:hypothetical protein
MCMVGGWEVCKSRLAELDRERDIERLMGSKAGSAVVVGCVLGATVARHPGGRTANEIEVELNQLRDILGAPERSPSV